MIKVALILLALACAQAAPPAAWTESVEVRHDDNLCLSYKARLDGPFLVVQATVEPGWHTFAMDNKQRAAEKLAGKPPLSIDRATEITLTGGLQAVGPWYQTPPKDFSKPELRWFSWGFEQQALFAAKIRHSGSEPARIAIRGQACTETTCKNIDVTISLPLTSASKDADHSEISLNNLVQVR
jgi:hypothetical protein